MRVGCLCKEIRLRQIATRLMQANKGMILIVIKVFCYSQVRRQRRTVVYYAVQLVGLCGSGGMRGVLHLLGQVPGAVQGVCGRPLEESLLSIEEDQLQGQVRAGSLYKIIKEAVSCNHGLHPLAFAALLWYLMWYKRKVFPKISP